ncbi:MAG: hypothetical protein E7310_06135 [Clostridiales bacterium]|nr:hypothetical protein [Clostridiales bacterium]
MNKKERNQIKQALKTKIDAASVCIKMLYIGKNFSKKAPEKKASVDETQEGLIKTLTEVKKDIIKYTDMFIKEIDAAIEMNK